MIAEKLFDLDCELCMTIDWKAGETHRIVMCKTCQVAMLVLAEHRQFTAFERELIGTVWHSKIRWKQRRIPGHAHCHFEAE